MFPTDQVPQAMKHLICPFQMNFSTKAEVLEIQWKVIENRKI